MKKRLLVASTLIALTNLQAQTTVDFEDLSLPAADTFYTGEDLAGQFSSGNVVFQNQYETTQWGYSWSGFAYSNMTDNQTPGFGNQYSSFAGSGADNSENYAVYYNGDTLVFPGSGVNLGEVQITNTSFAGISMRDGDQFAKQFGSPNGADGQPDGTNGEDFFYVTISGWDQQGQNVGSIDIYLADFRFSDANDDYILQDWTTFDLSALNGSKYFTFEFTSSDVGQFGINTPLYFAMDNLVYTELDAGIEDNSLNEITLYPNPSSQYIHILGDIKTFIILSSSGEVKLQGENDGNPVQVGHLSPGLYFVTNPERTLTKKLIIE